MAAKQRADHLAHVQGLAESREQAKRLIMAGLVLRVDEGEARIIDKPGSQLPEHARLQRRGEERFVSRGAYKLLTALEYFSLDARGLVVLDAGASTGGFTHCLLEHGAARVYAVDVGKNQLHERLRADPRVVSLEGVNLRLAAAPLSPDVPPLIDRLIPELVDLVVADVSFISLTLILPACLRRLKKGGCVAALIKPQFEVGPNGTVRGVVKNEELRQAAVNKVLDFAREALGLVPRGVIPSAIKGPKGNQEYMAVWTLPE